MGLALGSGGAMGMGQHFSGMMHPMQMQGVQMQGMQMQGMHSMGYVPQQMSAAAAPLQSGETAAAHSSAGTSQVRLWPHSMLSHVPVDSFRVGAPGSFQMNAIGAAHYGLIEGNLETSSAPICPANDSREARPLAKCRTQQSKTCMHEA